MSPIDRLTQLFEKFPGIGPRQARRFVHYLLVVSPATRAEFAAQIQALGAATAQCRRCFRWFTKEGKAALCNICSNDTRDKSTLFVVEKDADIDTVEKTAYRGVYFVLGGTIPLGVEEPQKYVRAKELLSRVEEDASASLLKEIILGLSATTEGDHTRELLQEKLLPITQGFNLKLSSLGRGLSTGSELEYADPDTISQALGNRH